MVKGRTMQTARTSPDEGNMRAEAVVRVLMASGELWVRLDSHFRKVETHDFIFF